MGSGPWGIRTVKERIKSEGIGPLGLRLRLRQPVPLPTRPESPPPCLPSGTGPMVPLLSWRRKACKTQTIHEN